MNGLLTLAGVHDGQSGVAQYALINLDMYSMAIGPTVALGLDHAFYI